MVRVYLGTGEDGIDGENTPVGGRKFNKNLNQVSHETMQVGLVECVVYDRDNNDDNIDDNSIS